MENIVKMRLADEICKALFGDNYVCADKEGEEKNPEKNLFERMGYVKIGFGSKGNVKREQLTFMFDFDCNVGFEWSDFDPFDFEGKDAMAAFLTGFMFALSGGKATVCEYIRAESYISFTMPAEGVDGGE